MLHWEKKKFTESYCLPSFGYKCNNNWHGNVQKIVGKDLGFKSQLNYLLVRNVLINFSELQLLMHKMDKRKVASSILYKLSKVIQQLAHRSYSVKAVL